MLRHILAFSLILLTLAPVMKAADVEEYTPFVREGSEWGYCDNDTYYGYHASNPFKYYYYIRGDTVINCIEYKKLNLRSLVRSRDYSGYEDFPPAYSFDGCYLAVREENKRVFAVVVNEIEIAYSCEGSFLPWIQGPYYDLTGEGVLYDFEDPLEFAVYLMAARYHNFVENYRNVLSAIEIEDPCVKAEGRRAIQILKNGRERGTIVEGIGLCSPTTRGELTSLDFMGIVACGARPYLLYMRNGDGVYEYIADGVDVTAVERIRCDVPGAAITLVDGTLEFYLPAETGNAVVDVLSSDGKSVAHLITSSGQMRVPVTHLTAGVYVAQIRSDKFRQNLKFIIR